MSFEDSTYEDSSDLQNLREEMIAVQASNIALAAIISCMPATAKLEKDEVVSACTMMCEMDAHTEMVTSEFAASILDIAKQIHKGIDE